MACLAAPGGDAPGARPALDAPLTRLHSSAATPYIHAYLKASGLAEVHDAYPFPAFEKWYGTCRYYLLSSRRSQIDGLGHPVDIDVLDTRTPGVRHTRNLCRGLPLHEAVLLFVQDALKQLRAEAE